MYTSIGYTTNDVTVSIYDDSMTIIYGDIEYCLIRVGDEYRAIHNHLLGEWMTPVVNSIVNNPNTTLTCTFKELIDRFREFTKV